jgi:hypothetical protein
VQSAEEAPKPLQVLPRREGVAPHHAGPGIAPSREESAHMISDVLVSESTCWSFR